MPPKLLRDAGVTTDKYDSCLKKVRGKGKNEYAICNASFEKSRGIKPRSVKKR